MGPRCSSDAVACALTALGDGLARTGLAAPAEASYGCAVRRQPERVEAWVGLGEARCSRGHWVGAAQAFAEATRLAPALLEAHGGLVLSLSRAGRQRAAAAAIEGLVRLRPFEAEPHLLRGALLARQGRAAEALRAFRWALRLQPPTPGTRLVLADAILGPAAWERTLAAWRSARAASAHRRPAAQIEGRSRLHDPPLGRLGGFRQGRTRRGARRTRPVVEGVRPAPRRPARAVRALAAVQVALATLLARRFPHLALRVLRRNVAIRETFCMPAAQPAHVFAWTPLRAQ